MHYLAGLNKGDFSHLSIAGQTSIKLGKTLGKSSFSQFCPSL